MLPNIPGIMCLIPSRTMFPSYPILAQVGFFFSLCAALCLPVEAGVQINEIMADNPGRPNDANALLDMDGNSPGWVELHNDGAGVVDLTGWALSDDPAVPAKWVFAAPVPPAAAPTTIAAGGYKIVFCGGLARNTANVELHTTFSPGNSGYVLLSQPDGNGGKDGDNNNPDNRIINIFFTCGVNISNSTGH